MRHSHKRTHAGHRFVEPGESLEAAARREVYEETGVEVREVEYVMSQPWPMPNSLMLGCMAQAQSERVVLHDDELEEARWFTADEVRGMVAASDARFMGAGTAGAGAGATFVPPASSIAGILIREWVGRWAPTMPAARM
ncbi:NADH pyrophosphatase [Blastocladiella emersonii ATCC 22665]|nr:NADH pyrophosphatase [Blastocladiella emersonii ATCC 22665]